MCTIEMGYPEVSQLLSYMKSLWQYMIAVLLCLSKSAYSVQYNIVLILYAQAVHYSEKKISILVFKSNTQCLLSYYETCC